MRGGGEVGRALLVAIEYAIARHGVRCPCGADHDEDHEDRVTAALAALREEHGGNTQDSLDHVYQAVAPGVQE